MAQELLDHPDVIAALQEMGRPQQRPELSQAPRVARVGSREQANPVFLPRSAKKEKLSQCREKLSQLPETEWQLKEMLPVDKPKE